MNLTRRDMMKRAALGVVAGAAVVGTGQQTVAAAGRGRRPTPPRTVDIENWLLSTVPRG